MDATKPGLRALLEKPHRPSAPTASEPENESDYTAYAHGRISRHTQQMLAFRFADGTTRGFAYAYLYCLDSPDINRGFTLDFTHHKVKVEGRNLETLARLIGQHRVAEVREAERSRSFENAASEPVVERITVLNAE